MSTGTGTSAWAPPASGGVPPQPAGPAQNVPAPPYGWTPPPAGGAPVPVQQATPRPPRMWVWALVTAGLMVIAIAATAAITYTIARSATPSASSTSAAPAVPAFTAGQQADAKQAVCSAFDVSTKGIASQGGARVDGQPNMPMLLRTLSGTVSMQSALTPAAPTDVADFARRVIDTNLNLLNAALGQANIDEVQRANDASNQAVDGLVSACGLK
jgi:hypothetical protein